MVEELLTEEFRVLHVHDGVPPKGVFLGGTALGEDGLKLRWGVQNLHKVAAWFAAEIEPNGGVGFGPGVADDGNTKEAVRESLVNDEKVQYV